MFSRILYSLSPVSGFSFFSSFYPCVSLGGNISLGIGCSKWLDNFNLRVKPYVSYVLHSCTWKWFTYTFIFIEFQRLPWNYLKHPIHSSFFLIFIFGMKILLQVSFCIEFFIIAVYKLYMQMTCPHLYKRCDSWDDGVLSGICHMTINNQSLLRCV